MKLFEIYSGGGNYYGKRGSTALTNRLTNDTALNDHLVHKFACKML